MGFWEELWRDSGNFEQVGKNPWKAAVKTIEGINAGIAIAIVMNEPNPDIGELPAYREDALTWEQKTQIDQILAKVARNRQSEIDGLRWQLRKNVKQIFDKMYKDIERLDTYGIHIDVSIHNQLELLRYYPRQMQLKTHQYHIGNTKCREVLEQEPGRNKRENFRKFENGVLSQSVDKYFEQLFAAFDAIFSFIDNSVKRKIVLQDTKTQQYLVAVQKFSREQESQKQQKAQIQAELQELESLKKLFV